MSPTRWIVCCVGRLPPPRSAHATRSRAGSACAASLPVVWSSQPGALEAFHAQRAQYIELQRTEATTGPVTAGSRFATWGNKATMQAAVAVNGCEHVARRRYRRWLLQEQPPPTSGITTQPCWEPLIIHWAAKKSTSTRTQL